MTYEDALEIAMAAHRGQKDKVGEPYIRHPLRVAERVEGERAQVVALLHDVFEDTSVALDEIDGLDDEQREALRVLTRDASQPYGEYIDCVARNPLARAVKLADLADNVERLSAWAAVDPEGDEKRREKYETARDRLLAA